MATSTATKQTARPLSYETSSKLAHRAALDAQVSREACRFHAMVALDALRVKMQVEAEVAKFRAFEKKYGPPTPKLHKLSDSAGCWWQCKNLTTLQKWIADRNQTLRQAKSPAPPAKARSAQAARSSGRSHDEYAIETKVITPDYRR